MPWRSIAIVVAGSALVVLALAWTIGPLAGAFDPAQLADLAARLRDWPPAPFAVVAIFVLGNFVAAPSTLMIGTTILLFGPLRGAAYAYAGMLVGGNVIYAIGRFAARVAVERWLARRRDPRIARFHERVAQHALMSVVVLRLTPVPYALQTVVLGAARIGYGAFFFGTMLGILPITLVLAGVAAQLEACIAVPGLRQGAWMIVTAVVLAAAAWAVRGWFVRRSARR